MRAGRALGARLCVVASNERQIFSLSVVAPLEIYMEVDGPAHACWARATVLCEARSRGACDAMQTDLFLEPDTLSTNLFFSLFVSSLPKSFSFFLDVDRRARAYCQARRHARRASGVRRAPGTRPARARHAPGIQ